MEEASNNSKKTISLRDVKSNFILKQIFGNLNRNKFFNIIRYNKEIQKRLDIDINDYKNEYSKIEIEIIPIENNYAFFINYITNKSYFHIFINDNKEELKRNYIIKNDNAKKIKVILDNKIKSFSRLFKSCLYIKKITFNKFNRKDINDMSYMFSDCKLLEKIAFSEFNTNNVENMEFMFFNCSAIKELNLSNFNTDNLLNMSNMFNGCSLINKLDISNFNTGKVIDMKYLILILTK